MQVLKKEQKIPGSKVCHDGHTNQGDDGEQMNDTKKAQHAGEVMK
jgi:hypothetical protein